jgi:magnesium transporter
MAILLHGKSAVTREITAAELANHAVDRVHWIDLLRATAGEISAVERFLRIELPTREEMREIESTSRLYCEGLSRIMTTPLLVNTDSDEPESTDISFVLHREWLVTLRDTEPQSFRQTIAWLAKRPSAGRDQIFIALLEAIIDRQADLLEKLSKETEELSQRIFRPVHRVKESESRLRDAIFRLGRSGNLIARERDCIVALSRLVQYAGHEDFEGGADAVPERKTPLFPRLKPLIRDLQSLSEFAGFLSSKVSFMLDATLGLINIEQNAIVKIFTVAAVIFLPPTLVASVYGMNFEFLPELHWRFGYPFAIGVMIVSVLLPCLFCRRKGWL